MSEEKKENLEIENKIETSDEDLVAQWAAMLENQPQSQQDLVSLPEVEKKEAESNTSENTEITAVSTNIDTQIAKKIEMILDIPVSISFEVGSRKMQIEDIVKLSPSSVIELDRYIDQPIDIKVNGVLVAKGELYQVEDNFAVRITKIISKEDRIKLISSQMTGG